MILKVSKIVTYLITLSFFIFIFIGCPQDDKSTTTTVETTTTTLKEDPNTLEATIVDNKFTIYQVMTRLFGNKNTTNKKYGTLNENGVGKFNDFTDKALKEIANLGITHVWYTGVIEHALMTDYSAKGIELDDADVVKGRAGSPYAIKDYYDVNPDLAVDVNNRMKEFEELVARTHTAGLKVIIDFVPNHVARKYKSDAKPAGVKDLGENDDKTKDFDPNNNFYYVTGKEFVVPADNNPLGDEIAPNEDGKFDENPAKVTGNDVFSATPGIGDWFETVKLNYGVDYKNNKSKHFDPVPDTWTKMKDILVYWANKNVDGFRCDMAEMVPVEFWAWAIPQVKAVNESVIFIAEIYNPDKYSDYVKTGKFDFLYDKVGVYDAIRPIITKGKGNLGSITSCWKESMRKSLYSNMLRFLENHDEQRISSTGFAGNPSYAIPGMIISSTLSSGPVMIYFGQEVGEPGSGVEGFGGEDGRTSIFDYWGVPNHQKWMNDGAFDGANLSTEQKSLREFYLKLLHLSISNEALKTGKFYELHFANVGGTSEGYVDDCIYSYIRYTDNKKLLIIVNFDKTTKQTTKLKIPKAAWDAMKLDSTKNYQLKDLLLTDKTITFKASDTLDRTDINAGVTIDIPSSSGYIFELSLKE
ncbi:MAG TPA: alpha-amylase family protein [Spirochaetota bacterium]|nr:alpha-amylase family protein [Spirochaetota bacterium]